jgi:hypothetical protein
MAGAPLELVDEGRVWAGVYALAIQGVNVGERDMGVLVVLETGVSYGML